MNSQSQDAPCSVCLVSFELDAVRILVASNALRWFARISTAGQTILKNRDFVMVWIDSAGFWRYRMRDDYRLKTDTGHPEDCEVLCDKLFRNEVYENLAVYYERRPRDRQRIAHTLDVISRASLSDKVKMSLEAEIGRELRATLGSEFGRIMIKETDPLIKQAIQRSLWQEQHDMDRIMVQQTQATNDPAIYNTVVRELMAAKELSPVEAAADTFLLQADYGMVGYVTLKIRGTTGRAMVNRPDMMRQMLQENQVQLYCGSRISEQVYKLDNTRLMNTMDHLSGVDKL